MVLVADTTMPREKRAEQGKELCHRQAAAMLECCFEAVLALLTAMHCWAGTG